MCLADRQNQQAFVRIAGDHHRSILPALLQMLPGIQLQAAHLRLRMASEAIVGEHRPDMLFKKVTLLLTEGGVANQKRWCPEENGMSLDPHCKLNLTDPVQRGQTPGYPCCEHTLLT